MLGPDFSPRDMDTCTGLTPSKSCRREESNPSCFTHTVAEATSRHQPGSLRPSCPSRGGFPAAVPPGRSVLPAPSFPSLQPFQMLFAGTTASPRAPPRPTISEPRKPGRVAPKDPRFVPVHVPGGHKFCGRQAEVKSQTDHRKVCSCRVLTRIAAVSSCTGPQKKSGKSCILMLRNHPSKLPAAVSPLVYLRCRPGTELVQWAAVYTVRHAQTM